MGILFTYALFVGTCLAAPFRPFYGVLGYVAFVALCPQWLWQHTLPDASFPFQKYIAGATMLGYVLSGCDGQKPTGPARRALQGGLLFLIACTASAFQSIAPDVSWYFVQTLSKMALLFYIGVRIIDTPKRAYVVLWVLLLCIAWNAWEINLEYFQKGYSTVNLPGNQWAYMNANGYSLILLIGASLAAAVASSQCSWPPRLVAASTSMLCVHAIFILESRSGMIGLLLTAATIVYYMQKSAGALCCVAVTGIASLALAGPSVAQEFLSSFNAQGQRDVSAESRFYMWDAGSRICLDYPMLGVGPWAGEWLMPKYYEYAADQVGETKALHNLPLEIASGCGIPALIAYVGLFFLPLWTLHRILQHRNMAPPELQIIALGCLAAIPAYWVASLFNSGALLETPYFVVVLSLAAAIQWERFTCKGFSSWTPAGRAVT